MAIKYIPLNNREIQIYRREQAIKEHNRDELIDNILISMRRANLFYQKKHEEFKKQSILLNEYVKKQNSKRVLEVINYFIADIS